MSLNKTCRMSSVFNIKGIEHFTHSWKVFCYSCSYLPRRSMQKWRLLPGRQ